MQDEPTPSEILKAVAALLRDVIVVESTPHTAFQARVAASALDLVRRQIDLAALEAQAEAKRLKFLMGQDGSLDELNAALADALGSGRFDLTTPGVADHLRATTLSKLAVDQPTYSGYRAALDDPSSTPLSKGET